MSDFKVVTLGFRVSDDVETTSENLALLKALLLGALQEEFQRDTRFSLNLTDHERALCKALLEEG